MFTAGTPTLTRLQWRIQDFPKTGAQAPQEGCQLMILPTSPKDCMKLKEFGPGGARPKFYYVDPPLIWEILNPPLRIR